MDFGINARLTASDYVGVDMAPVREAKRAHEASKVRSKDQAEAGTIKREQESLEQAVQRLERASQKLETAGRTVHQVEDLLDDTLSGFRANRAENRPASANQRLLQSADETAHDIVGFARFDEEMVFPPSGSPIRFEHAQARNAYAKHNKALRDHRGTNDSPEVRDVIDRTNYRLRGEGGVLPTLNLLSEKGHENPELTEDSLSGLKQGMNDSRAEIDSTRRRVLEGAKENTPLDAHIDVAS